MICYDSEIAYLVPDESREKYFLVSDWVLSNASKFARPDDIINANRDPIVVFNTEHLSQTVFALLKLKMFLIGAKEITTQLQHQ